MTLSSCTLHSQAIVYTINCGMNYQPAGPLYLAGGTASYRTPLPEEIKTFDQFKVGNP